MDPDVISHLRLTVGLMAEMKWVSSDGKVEFRSGDLGRLMPFAPTDRKSLSRAGSKSFLNPHPDTNFETPNGNSWR